MLQQYLPFTVLKPFAAFKLRLANTIGCNSTYRLRYWNSLQTKLQHQVPLLLQQLLPFTVCAEGGETAEEQSDDEVRTSQVPERSEGKTKLIRQ